MSRTGHTKRLCKQVRADGQVHAYTARDGFVGRSMQRWRSKPEAVDWCDPQTRGDLGSRVRMSRINAGFTQAELAAAVGMTRHMLAKIESGNAGLPASSIVLALAAALHVTEDWLRSGSNSEDHAMQATVDGLPAQGNQSISDLRTGLALLRGLRSHYVLGRLSHAQLRAICDLASDLATTMPLARAPRTPSLGSLGQRLRERRIFLGKTLAELAQSANVPMATLREMESDATVDISSLPQIAHALDVNETWLTSGVYARGVRQTMLPDCVQAEAVPSRARDSVHPCHAISTV